MTENEELIFGLKRWLSKANIYCGYYTFDEFIKDDLVFDATCFCIETISDIGLKLVKKYSSFINEKYPTVDFNYLSNLKSLCFVGDNINLGLIYELASFKFKEILLALK